MAPHSTPNSRFTTLPRLPRARFSAFPPFLRTPFLTLFTFLTWLPVLSFFHTHVSSLMRVTGPSMYPFLNTDYHTSTQKDVVWVWRWNPANGVKRGMVVAFW